MVYLACSISNKYDAILNYFLSSTLFEATCCWIFPSFPTLLSLFISFLLYFPPFLLSLLISAVLLTFPVIIAHNLLYVVIEVTSPNSINVEYTLRGSFFVVFLIKAFFVDLFISI